MYIQGPMIALSSIDTTNRDAGWLKIENPGAWRCNFPYLCIRTMPLDVPAPLLTASKSAA